MRLVKTTFLIVIVMVSPANASNEFQNNFCWCESDKTAPGKRVDACTWLLNSKELSEANIPAVHNYRGVANLRKGLGDQAIMDFNQSIHLKPDFAKSYFDRGIVYYSKGLYDRAIHDFDDSIRLKPDKFGEIPREVTPIILKDVTTGQSRFSIEPSISNPLMRCPITAGVLPMTHRACDGRRSGIKVIWFALGSNCLDAYYRRGKLYRELGYFDRAIRDYDQAIRLRPQSANSHYYRGLANHRMGRFDRAIRDYDLVIRLKPTYAAAYNDRGNAHRSIITRYGI